MRKPYVFVNTRDVLEENKRRGGADRLEGGDLARLRRDVVHQDTTLGLGAEPVVELEAAKRSVEHPSCFWIPD
jgi:hypothetical protein